MAFKFVLLTALVACASAGGPASYSISALSGDGAYLGSSQEHTVKGLYGQNVLSQYSKAVDSAHSSVRVHSSRSSNDIIGAHGGLSPYGVPQYGLNGVNYGGLGVAKVVSNVGLGVPSVVGHGISQYGVGIAGLQGLGINHGYHGYGLNNVGVSKVVSNVGLPSVVSHGINPYGVSSLGHNVVSPYGARLGGLSAYGLNGVGLGYGGLGVSKVVGVPSVVGHGINQYGVGIGGLQRVGLGINHGISPYSNYGLGVSKVVSNVGLGPSVVSHGINPYGVSSLGHNVVSPYAAAYGAGLGVPYGLAGSPLGLRSSLVSPLAVKTAVASPVVAHASVIGHGASYSW